MSPAPTTKPKGMKLILSRVEEKDFDELLEVQYKAFGDVDVHQALFGPNTKENRDRVKEAFVKDMHNDVADYWMKLVDATTGRIVSASQWKIYPSWVTPKEHHKFEAPFYEGDERKWSEYMGNDFYRRRGEWANHPHVCECSHNSCIPIPATNCYISTVYPVHRPRLPAMRCRIHTRKMGNRSSGQASVASMG